MTVSALTVTKSRLSNSFHGVKRSKFTKNRLVFFNVLPTRILNVPKFFSLTAKILSNNRKFPRCYQENREKWSKNTDLVATVLTNYVILQRKDTRINPFNPTSSLTDLKMTYFVDLTRTLIVHTAASIVLKVDSRSPLNGRHSTPSSLSVRGIAYTPS